ncbi:MAG: hypothetical protein Q8S33_06635 [Myxococcales bacterium]|nr:hypothetical protein [Myxococcales bacterium]
MRRTLFSTGSEMTVTPEAVSRRKRTVGVFPVSTRTRSIVPRRETVVSCCLPSTFASETSVK